jgi:hypothetical protein
MRSQQNIKLLPYDILRVELTIGINIRVCLYVHFFSEAKHETSSSYFVENLR